MFEWRNVASENSLVLMKLFMKNNSKVVKSLPTLFSLVFLDCCKHSLYSYDMNRR